MKRNGGMKSEECYMAPSRTVNRKPVFRRPKSRHEGPIFNRLDLGNIDFSHQQFRDASL
jgi:hypothetical protein